MSGFCVNCGTALPEGAGFCPKCGTKIEVPHCPACGKEIDYGTDFCIYCGHPLTTKRDGASAPAESPELNSSPGPSPTLDTSSAPVQATSDISPTLIQHAEEVPLNGDVQEFSWSYFKLGFTKFSNSSQNVTAKLTKEKLHVTEQKRKGWKSTKEETDIALIDIRELCIRSKSSIFYWISYSALITICVFAAYVGVLDAAACIMLALTIGIFIWVASFNLFHNELVILVRDDKKIVLSGAKKAVFQQLQQGIASKTGVRVEEPKSSAITIFLSVCIGIAAIAIALLLLGGRTIKSAGVSSLTEDELIGRWDLQYMEDDGEIYSYDLLMAQGYTANEIYSFFHSIYIQFFEDGSFELTATYEDGTPEQICGTWTIKDSRIMMTSASTTVEGYLHDGLFYIESEDFTARFEHGSTAPIKTPDHFDEPDYQPDYEPSEAPQPSITPSAASPTVSDALYKVMSEKTLFSVQDGYYTEFGEPAQVGMMNCDSIAPGVEGLWYDTVSFAIIDMDGDGENEIVLFGDSGFDGLYTVLHEYEGTVYGYTVEYRGMNPLLANGLFGGSDGAADYYISRFAFDGSNARIIEMARESGWDDYSYYVNGNTVLQETYNSYLLQLGWNWDNEAVFYDYTDANIRNLLAP